MGSHQVAILQGENDDRQLDVGVADVLTNLVDFPTSLGMAITLEIVHVPMTRNHHRDRGRTVSYIQCYRITKNSYGNITSSFFSTSKETMEF